MSLFYHHLLYFLSHHRLYHRTFHLCHLTPHSLPFHLRPSANLNLIPSPPSPSAQMCKDCVSGLLKLVNDTENWREVVVILESEGERKGPRLFYKKAQGDAVLQWIRTIQWMDGWSK